LAPFEESVAGRDAGNDVTVRDSATAINNATPKLAIIQSQPTTVHMTRRTTLPASAAHKKDCGTGGFEIVDERLELRSSGSGNIGCCSML